MRIAVETSSPEATESLGRRVGARLRPGDTVALVGPLGSGKTVLARGLALGAGASGHMASPSFVIIREYAGTVRIYHADLYRLDHPGDLAHLGLEELMDGDGIVIVEWADRAPWILPADHLWVECAFGEADTCRLFVLSAPAGMADRLAAAVEG